MNKERKTEIKVGITVIVGLALFIWVLGWAKNFSLSDNSQLVKVEFTTVSGLNKGDVVTVNGVKKGYVEDIELLNNRAVVTVNIDRDIQLKKDATFSVAMLDLMGGKKVDVLPGNSDELLDTDKIQEGGFAGDISSAMAALSSVQTDIVVLIKEVRDAVTKVNSSFLSDEFIAGINQNLADLNTLLKASGKFVKNNSEAVTDLINNSNKLVAEGNEILTSNKEELSAGLKNLNELLENSNKLLVQINELSDETKNKKNNLGKILYDDKFFKEMETTLKETNKLIRILLNQIEKEGIKVDANIF